MKKCLLCGELVGADVATCPKDGEASWSESRMTVQKAMPVKPTLEEVTPELKRGPGRPRKNS